MQTTKDDRLRYLVHANADDKRRSSAPPGACPMQTPKDDRLGYPVPARCRRQKAIVCTTRCLPDADDESSMPESQAKTRRNWE